MDSINKRSVQNKKTKKIKPIFYLLKNNEVTRVDSSTSSKSSKSNSSLKNKLHKLNKLNKKTKKTRLKTPNDFIIMPSTVTTENIVHSFKQFGISVLEELNETQLENIIELTNNMYYNNEPLLTDIEYDIIKEFIEHKFPHNKILKAIGAPVIKNKVNLPYEMPSMDKIKPDTDALDDWKQRFQGPYIVSCKLDGVSAMFTTEGDAPKLYTRGNGIVGQDISYLIPYLNLPKKKDITIRGELLVTKSDFEKYLKSTFANARNLVSGMVNQKKIDENIKYLHFVAYEVIRPELKPSEQMDFLKTFRAEHVLYKSESKLTNDLLSNLLITWRKEYIYEIDGIIVTDNKLYPRKSGNPKHAFAFKMILSDQLAEAKVVDVIWNASKDGYLKPRVRIEPVHLGGVTIEYATGFNANFIETNKVGIGAMIEIIRSGDVIPHIKSITHPAETAKMPNVPYIWNASHIDILLEDVDNDPTVKEKNITGFFHGIGVDGLSSGNIKRIIDAGYTSIPEIVHMTEPDFLKVDGFKQKLATKIHSGIQEKVQNASLIKLMIHSNIFGRGLSEKKIEAIMTDNPTILTSDNSILDKINEVSKIKGMATKTAENFVTKINIFKSFLKDIKMDHLLHTNTNTSANTVEPSHILYKKNIVMTGTRDKELTEELKKIGANITTTVNKNTFILIASNKNDTSTKIEDANKLQIPIVTIEEFKEQFLHSF
jgi:NAD-dependent DNA ligase